MKKLLSILILALSTASFAQTPVAFDFQDPGDSHSTGIIDGTTNEIDMVGGFKEGGSNTLSNDISGNAATATNATTAGSTSGNAATASALEANGSNCGAGNYPLGVDEAGNAESCTAAGAGDGNAKTLCSDGEFLRGEDATTCRTAAQVISDGGGAGVAEGDDADWTGAHSWTQAPQFDLASAATGKWWQAQDADGNGEWVGNDALPSDPKLGGIHIQQYAATGTQQFWGSTLGAKTTALFLIGSPPLYFGPGGSQAVADYAFSIPNATATAMIMWRDATIANLTCYAASTDQYGFKSYGTGWLEHRVFRNMGFHSNGSKNYQPADAFISCKWGLVTPDQSIRCTSTDTMTVSKGDTLNLGEVCTAQGSCAKTGVYNVPNGHCYFEIIY